MLNYKVDSVFWGEVDDMDPRRKQIKLELDETSLAHTVFSMTENVILNKEKLKVNNFLGKLQPH